MSRDERHGLMGSRAKAKPGRRGSAPGVEWELADAELAVLDDELRALRQGDVERLARLEELLAKAKRLKRKLPGTARKG
jgi:hypothetical protein